MDREWWCLRWWWWWCLERPVYVHHYYRVVPTTSCDCVLLLLFYKLIGVITIIVAIIVNLLRLWPFQYPRLWFFCTCNYLPRKMRAKKDRIKERKSGSGIPRSWRWFWIKQQNEWLIGNHCFPLICVTRVAQSDAGDFCCNFFSLSIHFLATIHPPLVLTPESSSVSPKYKVI